MDPNVLVSALISTDSQAPPRRIIEAVVTGRAGLVASPQLLGELRAVLSRRHLRPYVSQAEAEAFVRELASLAQIWPDPINPARASRDRTDDYLVAIAREAGAVLVSGDRDLTDDHERQRIHEEHGVEIRTAREAVDHLER